MTDLGSYILSLYVWLTRLAAPVARLIVGHRLRRGKEDAMRWRERLGYASQARHQTLVVWVHAVSVGETVAAIPLIERLTDAGFTVVATTVTTTSAALAEFRTGPSFIHQYAPLDTETTVERFLDHWQPILAVFFESELWPVTVACLNRHSVPLVIANGRLSERSARRWKRFSMISRAVFSRIDLVLAQSSGDADRYLSLGAARVDTVGNVKFDADVPEASEKVLEDLCKAIGGRPVLLAASTHPGEEALVLAAFAELKRRIDGLLLVIAPRHPVRGEDVVTLAAPFRTLRRSEGGLPDAETEVYVADTLGELGTLYRLADVALIGGSLVPDIGGHNPIEPARLGTVSLTGPFVANWTDVFAAFVDAGGMEIVRSASEIATAAGTLLVDPALRESRAAAAKAVADAHAGALGRTIAAIAPFVAVAKEEA